MAYYNVEMLTGIDWCPPDEEDWRMYSFDTEAEAVACMEHITGLAEFKGRTFRIRETRRYELMLIRLSDNEMEISFAYDTVIDAHHAGKMKLQNVYTNGDYRFDVYDTVEDRVVDPWKGAE